MTSRRRENGGASEGAGTLPAPAGGEDLFGVGLLSGGAATGESAGSGAAEGPPAFPAGEPPKAGAAARSRRRSRGRSSRRRRRGAREGSGEGARSDAAQPAGEAALPEGRVGSGGEAARANGRHLSPEGGRVAAAEAGVAPASQTVERAPEGGAAKRRRKRRSGSPGRAGSAKAPAATQGGGKEEAAAVEIAGGGPDSAPPSGSPPECQAAGLRRVLINATDDHEIRIAVTENGRLEELYYERPGEVKYLGNIYKGRVLHIEPGIQAAFVDLGIGRNGFLHVSDVLPVYKDASGIPIENLSQRLGERRRLKVQELLRKGQEVLVQISKDSIGAKGPSLTTYVSVPGRYLVLMPGLNRFGVSKRIQDSEERALLRKKLANLSPPSGLGYIVRTAGQDRPEEVLKKDLEELMGVWDGIRREVENGKTPSLVYAESDLVIRTIRDLLGAEVTEILVDSEAVYERARRFLLDGMPQAAKRLKHYTGRTPIFVRFAVESEIDKIYNRRVPLPSGGGLVIEQTEALVAIDVNSGKYRQEEDLEATALKINLEAAEEVVRQLRLRDLGGVIIIDFIDMESAAHRREVEKALRTALKKDRAKTWITRISKFGIIEMTRQRVRQSFERSHYEPCERCGGTGMVKSPRSTGLAVLRQLHAAPSHRRWDVCEVRAHASVVDYLLNERRERILEVEEHLAKRVVVRADASLSPESFVVKYH